MKRKKLLASIATFALSIAFMMFGVYAAASPSVKLSGQISYSVYDAKVLARGRIENAKTFDGSADVNAATYPTKNDADYKTSTKVNTQSQYLDYTTGANKNDNEDNFTTWAFGDIAFNENNVNPIKMYLEFTNYSLYDIVATITFEKTEQELTTGNLKRTVSETEVVIAGFNQTATSKEILIEYDVLNRGTKVNKFNVNASITIEQYFDEGGNGGGSQTPTNPPNATLEGWTYTDNGDGTIQLTAYNGSETEIVVPTILDGKTVTSLVGGTEDASMFANEADIASIEFPSTLESFGQYAMNGDFGNLVTLTFNSAPPALTDGYFNGYAEYMYVPDEYLDAYEFDEDLGGDNYAITKPISAKTTYTEGDWTYYYSEYKGGVTITNYAGSETEVEIPSQLPVNGQNKNVVSVMGDGWDWYGFAGENTENITSVTLPDTLKEVGKYFLMENTNITEIDIPDSVTIIGNSAFSSCESLSGIDIPDGVTTIGISAFSGCESLTGIELPSALNIIGYNAFHSTAITKVEIPGGVVSIGEWTFSNCSNLTEIEILEGVTSLGAFSFYNCSKIETLILPSTLEFIGEKAFGEQFANREVGIVVTSYANNPPELESGSFYMIEYILVPFESVEDYKNDDNWGNYNIYPLYSSALESNDWKYYYFENYDVNGDGVFVGTGVYLAGYVGDETHAVVPETLPVNGVQQPVVGALNIAFFNCANVETFEFLASFGYFQGNPFGEEFNFNVILNGEDWPYMGATGFKAKILIYVPDEYYSHYTSQFVSEGYSVRKYSEFGQGGGEIVWSILE